MSAIKSIRLTCDNESCSAWIRVDNVTERLARVNAAIQSGWRERDGHDFCPIHQPVPTSSSSAKDADA